MSVAMQGWPTWRAQAFLLPTVRIPNMRLQSMLDFWHFHLSISQSHYSKGVWLSWYPSVTLEKTACDWGSWRVERSSGSRFHAEENGSAGVPAVCFPMRLNRGSSWILSQPAPTGFSSHCWFSFAQSWGFRLSVTPTSKLFTIDMASPWHRSYA